MIEKKIETPAATSESDTVNVSRAELDALMARVRKMEQVESGDVANPIIARTCNSCGKPVNAAGKCETHPTEFVNHVAMGRDPENGLKRPVIASQTRNA